MRFRLRTLLIVLAIAPPTMAGLWYAGIWLAEGERYFGLLGALLAAASLVAGLTLTMWTHNRWIRR